MIENIYADEMYVTTSEKPGGAGSAFMATIVKNHSISRNTFRIDLTSLEKGTYYIHTGACYAMYCYKLVLK